MDKTQIDKLLRTFPGSKRAAEGVLIKAGPDAYFHAQSAIPADDMSGLSPDEAFYLAFLSKKEILRLREVRDSHDYLLRLRAEAIVDAPRLVRVMRARRKAHEATGRPWALTHYYHSLDFHHKALLSVLRRADARVLKAMPTGMVPIPDANAACIASLVGEIVVVSESLRHFFYFMTIALFGRDLKIQMADRINAVLIAFRIMRGSESSDFDLDPRGLLPRELERSIRRMVDDQMQFTYAHEYAHYLLGHMEVSSSVSMSGDREVARAYSHNCEYEADAHTLQLVRHSREATSRIASGGVAVLSFLSLLRRLQQSHGKISMPVSDTHPDPLDRLDNLKKAMRGHQLGVGVKPDGLVAECEILMESFPILLSSAPRSDILDFYGSVYLPTYRGRDLRDRVDY
jgi:hypothetical protein